MNRQLELLRLKNATNLVYFEQLLLEIPDRILTLYRNRVLFWWRYCQTKHTYHDNGRNTRDLY